MFCQQHCHSIPGHNDISHIVLITASPGLMITCLMMVSCCLHSPGTCQQQVETQETLLMNQDVEHYYSMCQDSRFTIEMYLFSISIVVLKYVFLKISVEDNQAKPSEAWDQIFLSCLPPRDQPI